VKYFGKAKNGNGTDSLQGMRRNEMRQILFHHLKGFDLQSYVKQR
jgi:hypothetical protein